MPLSCSQARTTPRLVDGGHKALCPPSKWITSPLLELDSIDQSEDVETNFQLSDTVYVNAVIKEPTNVCLWLGANVMVEYPIDDAFELLTENRDNAHVNLKSVDEDIQFLRDQITTTEVNIARIFNYDVMQRRKKKESGGETSGGAEGGD